VRRRKREGLSSTHVPDQQNERKSRNKKGELWGKCFPTCGDGRKKSYAFSEKPRLVRNLGGGKVSAKQDIVEGLLNEKEKLTGEIPCSMS